MSLELGISGIDWSERFKRAFNKLDTTIQERACTTIEMLLQQPASPGRDIKKMRGNHNPPLYKIRVNQNFRLSFHMEDGIAVLRNINTHDKLHNNP